MTSPIYTIAKDASIKEALEIIKNKHFRRAIAVNEENKLSCAKR